MAGSITGTSAVIRWGYRDAAVVSSWSAPISKDTTVTGTVSSVDAFRVSQRPLTFVVTRESGDWRWPITSLQIDGLTFRATVTLPQE